MSCPEAGPARIFKQYLLKGRWRRCESCDRQHQDLVCKLTFNRVAWVCEECSSKLVYALWDADTQRYEGITVHF